MIIHNKPNFFIVGAPKCGTTSLYNYLAQHPDVFMSKIKEPCFFASDFQSPYYPKTMDEYLMLFEEATDEKRVGEATSTYLYSLKAAQEIKEFCPFAKIIVMLRNPVDVMYSLHGQRLWEGIENIKNFKKALEIEYDRKKGNHLPKGLKYPKQYLYYREIVDFASQVERYLRVFPIKNIHVIVFEDFKNETRNTYNRICDFLEIDHYDKINFDVYNPAKIWKSLFVRRLVRSRKLQRITRLVMPIGLRENIKPLAFTQSSRPSMSNDLKHELITEFKPSIQRLSDLIDRDLRYWYCFE